MACAVQWGITCTETPHGPSLRYLSITVAKALRPRLRDELTIAHLPKSEFAMALHFIASETATSADSVCSSLCRSSCGERAVGKLVSGSLRMAASSGIVRRAEP